MRRRRGAIIAVTASALLLAPATAAATSRAVLATDVPSARHLGARAAGDSGNLPYQGGPVLHANRTHVLFWQPQGSGLTFDPGYIPLVKRFLAGVAAASHHTSNVFALSGQYTDGSGPAVYASRFGGAVLDRDRLPANGCSEPPTAPLGWNVCLTDAQLQGEIERVARARRLPRGPDDVYLLLTPRGFGSCLYPGAGGLSNSCALSGPVDGYCGYHSPTSDGRILYGVIPYNAVTGHCQSDNPRPNRSTADPTLSTVSHELSEIITDPWENAWINNNGYENGDLCLTSYGPNLGGSSGPSAYDEVIHGGHYYLQEEWSNASGACAARARPDLAWFAVSRRHGRTLSLRAGARGPRGPIRAYHWSFGDGSTGHGRRITHRFPRRAGYRLSLRITDSWGNWGRRTRSVRA